MSKLGSSNFSSALQLKRNQLLCTSLLSNLSRNEILWRLSKKFLNTLDLAYRVFGRLVYPIQPKVPSFLWLQARAI